MKSSIVLCVVTQWLVLWSAAAAPPPVIFQALPAVPPRTQATVDATRAAVDKARDAFRKRRYRAAEKYARKAWTLRPNASTALFLATIVETRRQPCEAFGLLLVGFDLDATDAERTLIEKGLARSSLACGRGYGWARITVAPKTAHLSISGKAVESGRTIGLSAGAHKLIFQAPGHAEGSARIQIERGQGRAPLFELAPAAGQSSVILADVSSEAWRLPTGASLTAVGGAMFVTGIALLGAAVATQSDAAQTQDYSDFESEVSTMYSMEAAGWALGGIGAAGLISGLVILTTGPSGVIPSVRLSPEAAHIGLAGRF